MGKLLGHNISNTGEKAPPALLSGFAEDLDALLDRFNSPGIEAQTIITAQPFNEKPIISSVAIGANNCDKVRKQMKKVLR